jgi:hypothetical protein
MYLKELPMRGLRRFKVRDNFASRFIDPFNITEEREEELKASFQVPFFDMFESRGRDSF